MSTQPKPPAQKKRLNRRTLIIGGVILFFLCGIISVFLNPDDAPEPAADVADQPAATDEPAEPTALPAPTDTPEPPAEPTATLPPDQALHAAVAEALGTSNRDVERLVSVEDVTGRIEVDWAINDNITEDLNRAAAQLDATDILRAIAQSGYDYDFVLMRGTFPLVDQFGTVEESKVVELFFERPTVDRINWDNFLHANIYDIADSAEIHPAFVRE